MKHFLKPVLRIAIVVFTLLTGIQAASKDKTKLRLICVSSLPSDTEVVLATCDEKGKWKEFGEVELRPSTISDWLSATTGAMHLAVRKDRDLKSVGEFQFPSGAKRALVALIADAEGNSYKVHLIDPARMEFAKGTVMVINASPQSASVSLGNEEHTLEAGREEVIKPEEVAGATHRVQVSYTDKDGKKVLCHDRQVSCDPESREMLFLLPDKTLVLKVASLPVFGSLD